MLRAKFESDDGACNPKRPIHLSKIQTFQWTCHSDKFWTNIRAEVQLGGRRRRRKDGGSQRRVPTRISNRSCSDKGRRLSCSQRYYDSVLLAVDVRRRLPTPLNTGKRKSSSRILCSECLRDASIAWIRGHYSYTMLKFQIENSVIRTYRNGI